MKRLIGALLVLASCASQAGERIQIVAISALSGTHSRGVRPGVSDVATRMAIDDLNQRGGLLGKKIDLIEVDSRSTALGARAAAQAAARLKPVAVIGERASSLSLVIAPILQAAAIPMISPNSTHPAVTRQGDYIFRLCFVDTDQGKVMADFAHGKLAARTAVVLVNVSQKHSEELARTFSARFVQQGGQVQLVGEYIQDSSDYGGLLEKVKVLKPDVLFLPGYAKDAGWLMRQSRQMGIKAIFLGGDAWGTTIADYAGPSTDGSYRTAHWHQDDPRPVSRAFVQSFIKRFGLPPSEGQVLAYDSVMALADAVRRANSFEAPKVRQALADTHNLELIGGVTSFDAERNARKPVVIVKYKQGSMVYVTSIAP